MKLHRFQFISARHNADLLNKLKNVCSKEIGQKMKVSMIFEDQDLYRFKSIYRMILIGIKFLHLNIETAKKKLK